MEKKTKRYVYATDKLKSNVVWLLLTCIAAAIASIAVIRDLAFVQASVVFMICPILMLVADIAFIICLFISNFRYRYALVELGIYIALTLILTLSTVLVGRGIGVVQAMSTVALVIWLVTHIVVVISAVLAYLCAARVKTPLKRVFATLFAGLAILIAIGYGVYSMYAGFFGQSTSFDREPSRPVLYEYDEQYDSYTAVGVVDGSSKRVDVAAEFNGKPVTAIEYSLFSADGVKEINLLGTDFSLINPQDLGDVDSGLTVNIEKDVFDSYKNTVYSRALNSPTRGDALVDVGNSMRPSGLDDEEVYVNFTYDLFSLNYIEGEIFPTWYGIGGSQLDIEAHLPDIDYLSYSDATSVADLHWNYENNNGYILNPILGSDGERIDGKQMTESATVSVTFDKIYRVFIGEDNDTLYENEDYKETHAGSVSFDWHYTIAGNADNIIDNMPEREGFGLSWTQGENKVELDSLSAFLDGNDRVNDITVYPVWSLNAPDVSLYAQDDNATTAIYGDNINLMTDVDTAIDGLDIAYTWRMTDGSETAGSGSYLLNAPAPKSSGLYAVTVTTSSDSITSLTASRTVYISVSIAKRELGFEWSLPDGVYSGLTKTVTVTANREDIVGNDAIDCDIESRRGGIISNIRDVGSYTSTIKLKGDTFDKYIIKGNATKSLTVTPYEVTLTWGETEFVYSGEIQGSKAEDFVGVGDDGEISVVTTQGNRNVGNYIARATVANKNYKVLNATNEYVINPKTVVVSSWSSETLIYNGRTQHPKATLSGVIATDVANVSYSIRNTGGEDVGVHTVNATGIVDNANYTLDTATNASCEYKIEPKGVTLNWSESRYIYDGKQKGMSVIGVLGAVQGQEADLIDGITYSYGVGNRVDTGEYTVTATLNNGNYILEGDASETLTIDKREITLAWSQREYTYDGVEHELKVNSVQNAVSGEESEIIGSLLGNGNVKGVKAGIYTASVTLPENSNYEIVDNSASATMTIAKRNLSVVHKGIASKEYDGTGITYTPSYQGLAPTDSIEEVVTLTCNTSPADAGSYEISATVTSQAKYDNYSVTVTPVKVTITKKVLTLAWDTDRTFVYDGKEYGLSATVTGVVADDEIGLVLSGRNSRVGTHTMIAEISNANYVISNPTAVYEIIEKVEKSEIMEVAHDLSKL